MRPFHANLAVLLTSVSFSDAYCIDMKTLLTTLSLHDISNVVDLFAFINGEFSDPMEQKLLEAIIMS